MKEDREKARENLCISYLKVGSKFTGRNGCFSGIVKPCSVDELTNLLHVRLYYKGSEWEEDWNLQHTVWGFEKGDYEWIDSTI